VRVTTAFNRLLDLPGVSVTHVSFGEDRVIVDVAPARRRLACPEAGCGFTTRARYDTRPVSSCRRHPDLGRWGLVVRADLRRLACPSHGVKVEAVPFARHRSGFTRDFEDVVAYLATRTDKTTITRLQRIDWDTVGRICARVVTDGLDTDRLESLVAIGIDEVSWKKHHNYLTLVADHTGKKIVWGAEGKDSETLDQFFAELGPERAAELAAVSMDMGPAFAKSVGKEGHAPQAVICIDPFHAVKLVGDALDTVRREAWNEMRGLGDQAAAKKFKGARWSLLKNPGAPRGALSYPRFSRERLEDVSLGLMTYPEAERRRGQEHVRKLATGSRYGDGASGGPRDMAKAGLLESQSPAMQLLIRRKVPDTDAASCPDISGWSGQPPGAGRCPMRAFKGTSGAPTSRCYVRQG